MGFLDDVVDGLTDTRSPQTGSVPEHHAAPRNTTQVLEHYPAPKNTTRVLEYHPAPRSTAQGFRASSNEVHLRFAVEVTDAQGNSVRANHEMSVPPGTLKMMEMFGEGADVLEQIAKSTILEVKKSITPQPGTSGGGAVLEQAMSRPGPVGGRTNNASSDPLASMLGLDLIERADALDRGDPNAHGPASVPRQSAPIGGPHLTGPRPGASHPRRR